MFRRVSVLVLSALCVAVLPASPAAASTTGEVVFHCDFALPEWPSANANGECEGTAVVSVSGIDDTGVPYSLAGPAAFHMFVNYSSSCLASGGPPLLWAAAGRIEVGPVLAVRGRVATQATLSADVVITGSPANFEFLTAGHSVRFGDGVHASGTTGFGEASTALVAGPSNVCPAGGPASGFVDGRWHLLQ